MLKYSFLIFRLCIAALVLPQQNNKTPTTLPVMHVVISGIKDHVGTVRVAIYNSAATFLQTKKYLFNSGVAVNDNTSVQIDFSMPNGDYAITTFHDLNDDKHLDQNYMGIPTEPYALSNNVSVKWRRPTFDETKISFNQQEQTVYLELKNWKDR